MFEDELINAVRQYPCLYDKNNRTSEKTKEILKRCWKNVAIETGAAVERCQSRWRSLRDRYVKERRNYVERNQVTIWRHMEDMQFLAEFIEMRPKKRYASYPMERPRDILETEKEEPEEESLYDPDRTESEEEPCNSSLKRSCDDDIDYQYGDEDVTQGSTEPKRPFMEAFVESPINEPLISQSYQKAARSRIDTRNAQTKFDTLVGTLNDYIKGRIKEREKCNNDDFYGLLNTYLAKLPENEQDKLKADILIMVLNKTREI